MNSPASNRLGWFKSQEGQAVMINIFIGAIWLSLGWILPIIKLRDPKVKTKTGWIMMLVLIGIVVPIFIFSMAVELYENSNPSRPNGTNFNSGPAAPNPVARTNLPNTPAA